MIYDSPLLDSFHFDVGGETIEELVKGLHQYGSFIPSDEQKYRIGTRVKMIVSIEGKANADGEETNDESVKGLHEFGSFIPSDEHKYPIGTKVKMIVSTKDRADAEMLGWVDSFDLKSGWYLVKYDNGGTSWMDEQAVTDIVLE